MILKKVNCSIFFVHILFDKILIFSFSIDSVNMIDTFQMANDLSDQEMDDDLDSELDDVEVRRIPVGKI